MKPRALHKKSKLFDGTVEVQGSRSSDGRLLQFPVVAFGAGELPLLIIPGLGDGLGTVRNKGRFLAWYYRRLSSRFRVYVISRPDNLPERYSTREMASDYAAVAARLNDRQCSWLLWGISLGGMIGQWCLIDHGNLFTRACLTVTTARTGSHLLAILDHWVALARRDSYGELVRDTINRNYTRKYRLLYKPFMPFMGLFGKPDSFERFLIQAEACRNHDALEKLKTIATRVLVVGGDSDEILGEGTSEELTKAIPGSESLIYPGLGHGAFIEAKGCTERIAAFLYSG